MQQFFKAAATQGRRAKAAREVTLDKILANNQTLPLLKQFMQAKQCDEIVEFWELAHAGTPQNPQQVYDTYINGQKSINIDNKGDFDQVNSKNPKDWNTAPWADAVSFCHGLMRNDTMIKLPNDPLWEQIYSKFGI